MIVKIYSWIWAVLVLAALAVLAMGSFTMMAGVVFGFIAFGMAFMGIIAVLPIWITHPVKRATPEAVKLTEAIPTAKAVQAEVRPAAVQFMGAGVRH